VQELPYVRIALPLALRCRAVVRPWLTAALAGAAVATLGPAAVPTEATEYPGAHNAVGASTWWAAGHTGGSGPSDQPIGALLIYGDDVNAAHPTFAGATILKIPGIGQTCSGSAECLHGTSTASLAVGRGVSLCPPTHACLPDDVQPDYKGVAPGAQTISANGPAGVYAQALAYDRMAWAFGFGQTGPSGDLPGATSASKVVSYSYAGSAGGISLFDAFASQHGVVAAMGAGNNGPAAGSTDCGTHNALCVGAIEPLSVTDHADDLMTDFSGRGPTPDGRKKPDLVAVGVTQAALSTWQIPGDGLWRNVSGTSYSTPQVAGAAALLMGAGITDPMAIRALLIDSARQGRATAAQAMGTQSGWQPDWGWGELDLTQAYAERTHLRAGTVRPGQPRFFSASTQGGGDRATLVWNRRATTLLTNTIPQNWNTTTYALTNLDLIERARSGCGVRTSSASAIDNVEQTRSPSGADVTYVVRSQSATIDGRDDEPFALGSTRQTTPLATPVPQLQASLSPSTLKGGDLATLSVTATNPSGDMGATDLQVTPQLPAGLELTSGAPTQTSASFPTGATREFTWTVRAGGDGQRTVAVAAQATACGEPVTSSAQTSLTVDSSGPTAGISAPTGIGQAGFAQITWSASDPSGVASYDVEAGVDDAPFQPWLTGTAATSAAHATATGHSYRWRVRGRDTHGHLGDWATSAGLTIPPPPAPPTPPPPGPVQASTVRIAQLSHSRRPPRIVLAGTVASGAQGGIYVTVRLWRGSVRKTLTTITTARAGRWKVTLKVPARHARFKRAEATARYDADFTYVGSLARRALRVR